MTELSWLPGATDSALKVEMSFEVTSRALRGVSVVCSLSTLLVVLARDPFPHRKAPPPSPEAQHLEGLMDGIKQVQQRIAALRGAGLPYRRLLLRGATDGQDRLWRELEVRTAVLESRVGSAGRQGSRLHDVLLEIEHHRTQILDPRTTPGARVVNYKRLLDLPSPSLHFDAPVYRQWLRDVYTETSNPSIAFSLAITFGRLRPDAELVYAGLHLCSSRDELARNAAVAGIGRILDSDLPERELLAEQLRAMSVYDPSEKVRAKAVEELRRLR